jgi:hypothetical protein
LSKNKNIKFIVNYLLGPLVFLLLTYAVYHQIKHQPDWHDSLRRILEACRGPGAWKIVLVFLLMFLNWGFEARKWQLALRNLEAIPFGKAFKATLAGTTMASFTPNRMGEYMGRILYVKEGKKLPAIPLTIVCSIAQMMVTLLAGMAGILFLERHFQEAATRDTKMVFWLNIFLLFVFFALALITLLYFRMSWLVRLLEKMRVPPKYLGYLKVLREFEARPLAWILWLSFGRYLVFIIQYFLMFSVFAVGLTWAQTFTGVSVMFLIMALVPSFTFLTELGLRWEASIQVIELFSANRLGIFAVSLGIWLVNLIIPALIGSLLILKIKLFRK